MSDARPLSMDLLRPFMVESADACTADFFVGNVHCGQCAFKIEKHLQGLGFIKKYQLGQDGKRLHLVAPNETGLLEATAGLERLGFTLTPYQQGADDTLLYKEYKKQIKQLAVAAVGAGNIMLYSTAVYFGAPEQLRHFFNGISLAVFVPIFLYAGRPILLGFWQGVRSRTFNLDIPIGIAMSFGAVYSAVNYLLGSDQVYFDSIAVVLFLVLTSRFLLAQYLQQFYQNQDGQMIPGVTVARLVRGENTLMVNPQKVVPGDICLVKKGEVVPVDGELLSETALLDTAVVTGEAEPRLLHRGQLVVAGTRVSHDSILVKTTAAGRQTRMGQIVGQALSNFQRAKEERLESINRFTQFVILASLLVLAYFGLQGLWSAAFHRAFAIVIVACPCAISFGLPLVRFLSSKLALQKGVLLKNPNLLSTLASIRHYCFDKTGTLTHSEVAVAAEDLATLSAEHRQALFSLEAQVDHPIARGILKHRPAETALLPVNDFRFYPGRGIAGEIRGHRYEVQTVPATNQQKQVELVVDGLPVGRLRLYPDLRDSARELFSDLHQQGLKVSLLSGDHQSQVQAIWQDVPSGARGQFLAGATPEEKQAFVQDLREPCIMVGDGINDVAALQQAAVGVSMPGALTGFDQLSDVSLLKGDLRLLSTLRKLALAVAKTENRMFAFTFTYNVICVVLAALGFINPIAAAILMPISSVVILLLIYFNLGARSWR